MTATTTMFALAGVERVSIPSFTLGLPYERLEGPRKLLTNGAVDTSVLRLVQNPAPQVPCVKAYDVQADGTIEADPADVEALRRGRPG
jgi:hypothetical protein